jgi:2-polyprenyl-6-methoxyphenol hydroxylase-like FAD-dependent oxidoreductase
LLDAFLRLPHLKVELAGYIGNVRITVADFTRLSGACKSLVLMPQWEFLNFLEDQARRYPGFHLMMNAQATGLIGRDGVVTGVPANTPSGAVEINAPLVVGCDGRHSTIRERAGLGGGIPRRTDGCAVDTAHVLTRRRRRLDGPL